MVFPIPYDSSLAFCTANSSSVSRPSAFSFANFANSSATDIAAAEKQSTGAVSACLSGVEISELSSALFTCGDAARLDPSVAAGPAALGLAPEA